jgi:hypothetical protein
MTGHYSITSKHDLRQMEVLIICVTWVIRTLMLSKPCTQCLVLLQIVLEAEAHSAGSQLHLHQSILVQQSVNVNGVIAPTLTIDRRHWHLQ